MSRPIITDSQIADLIGERKVLQRDWLSRLDPRPKAHAFHLERELTVSGVNGNQFKLFVRQNIHVPNGFTVGLRWVAGDGTQVVLRRYNGNNHQHTNHLEKRQGQVECSFRFRFHIHIATQRYQENNLPIEGFAVISSDYSTINAAMHLMIADASFDIESDDDPNQLRLPI